MKCISTIIIFAVFLNRAVVHIQYPIIWYNDMGFLSFSCTKPISIYIPGVLFLFAIWLVDSNRRHKATYFNSNYTTEKNLKLFPRQEKVVVGSLGGFKCPFWCLCCHWRETLAITYVDLSYYCHFLCPSPYLSWEYCPFKIVIYRNHCQCWICQIWLKAPWSKNSLFHWME